MLFSVTGMNDTNVGIKNSKKEYVWERIVFATGFLHIHNRTIDIVVFKFFIKGMNYNKCWHRTIGKVMEQKRLCLRYFSRLR